MTFGPMAKISKKASVAARAPKITPKLVAAHGLKPDEYDRLRKLIGRTPSFTELGIFSAMWNEHCSYKSSKIHLRTLPTKAPWVIQGPGENAGVIDIGDGLAVVFKMESHNHPSYIEPYQGAATGVGRIRRGRRGEAPDRAGWRSVFREAAARSLPGDHGQGLRDRDPGHGCGRADLFGGGDGRQGQPRRRSRTRQGAGPRNRHERLRDDAVGEPGAHAHGAQARKGSRGRGDLQEMGA